MNKKEFEEKLVERIHEKYKEVDVCIKEVKKNNGVTLRGMVVVLNSEVNTHATFYVENLYENYLRTDDFEAVVSNLIRMIEKHSLDKNIDISMLTSFAQAKNHLRAKVINTEKNKELLKDVPNVPFLDLSVVAYVPMDEEQIGEGNVLINNTIMENWNIDSVSLIEEAVKNTEGLSVVTSIEEQIFALIRKSNPAEVAEMIIEGMKRNIGDNKLPMYVITNERKCFGASALLSKDTLQKLAEKVESDLFILPSSIHEIIVVPTSECNDVEFLKQMVKEVNGSEVSEEEFLSNSVYFYDRKEEKLDAYVEASLTP